GGVPLIALGLFVEAPHVLGLHGVVELEHGVHRSADHASVHEVLLRRETRKVGFCTVQFLPRRRAGGQVDWGAWGPSKRRCAIRFSARRRTSSESAGTARPRSTTSRRGSGCRRPRSTRISGARRRCSPPSPARPSRASRASSGSCCAPT